MWGGWLRSTPREPKPVLVRHLLSVCFLSRAIGWCCTQPKSSVNPPWSPSHTRLELCPLLIVDPVKLTVTTSQRCLSLCCCVHHCRWEAQGVLGTHKSLGLLVLKSRAAVSSLLVWVLWSVWNELCCVCNSYCRAVLMSWLLALLISDSRLVGNLFITGSYQSFSLSYISEKVWSDCSWWERILSQVDYSWFCRLFSFIWWLMHRDVFWK